jgi:hypothetical protein
MIKISYAVDDVSSSCSHLNDLLDVICSLQFDLGIDEKDRRVDSLLWIARDLSEGIVAKLDENSAKTVREVAR